MELIVVGFHRSGTSLVTQLLHAAGLFVGDDLLGARPSNPYGHFEDLEVMRLHQEILDRNGSNWQADRAQEYYISPPQWRRMQRFVQARQSEHRTWGFKDPRTCLFLGPWKYLLPDAKFLVVYRDPADCVRSLHARHSEDYLEGEGPLAYHRRFFTEPDHALRVWDTYNRAVVAFVRQNVDDCLVLPYDALPAGYPVIEKVNQRFGATLEVVPTEAVFDANAAGRVESPQWAHDHAVADRVARTWQELEALTTRTDPR